MLTIIELIQATRYAHVILTTLLADKDHLRDYQHFEYARLFRE